MSSSSGTTSSGVTIERLSVGPKAPKDRRHKKDPPRPLPSKVTLAERNEVILKYLPAIRRIAFRVSAKPNGAIPRDGLVNAGVIGLIDALNKFDSREKVRFKTYAGYRIRGAMLDELRSMDFASRCMRLKSKEIEKARQKLMNETLAPAEDEDVAKALGFSLEKYYEQENSVRFDIIMVSDYQDGASSHLPKNDGLSLISEDQRNDPFFLYTRKENRRILAQAVDLLDRRERMVITLYYYEELRMKEIAEIFGFTESRICQVLGQAIQKLKTTIGKLLYESSC